MNNPLILILLIAIIIAGVGYLVWDRNRTPRVRPVIGSGGNIPLDHPQRRDVGGYRFRRWIVNLLILLILIPGIISALPVTIAIRVFEANILWPLIIGYAVGLCMVASLLLQQKEVEVQRVDPLSGSSQRNKEKRYIFMELFFVFANADEVICVQKEVGQRLQDTEGFPMLGLYFTGISPKYFWETIEFIFDLSRDLLVTSADLPGNEESYSLLETKKGGGLKVSWQFAIRPSIPFLQNLAHSGGKGADALLPGTNRTKREELLVRTFASQAGQRLSQIFGNNTAEDLRRKTNEYVREWAGSYHEQTSADEERYGVELGAFAIGGIDFDAATKLFREQEQNQANSMRAIEVILRPQGFTTDQDLWNTSSPNNVLFPHGEAIWLPPTKEVLSSATAKVQLDAGLMTKEVKQFDIPALEGANGPEIAKAIGVAVAAYLAQKGGQTP